MNYVGMAEGLGKLFGEVHKPAALQKAVSAAKARERQFAEEKQKLVKQRQELKLLQGAQAKEAKVLGKKKGVHYRDIQEVFARGDDITNLIRDTLLTHGAMPHEVPVTLLQNTNPETTCYMNSVLQCIASLPGFVGAETWPLIEFNENDPFEVKGAQVAEAFQELLEAMRAGAASPGQAQVSLLTKQAAFYTRMFEYTKVRSEALGQADGGERLWPLMQSDADTFRTLLFELLTKQNIGPKKGVRTRNEPDGYFMLRPLFGFFRVTTAMPAGVIGPALAENRTMESLIEVAVPPISPPTNEDNNCGLNAFINDADEVKVFRHLPDTLILRAGIFGFEGKYAFPIPIVPEFDMRTYHQPDWQPTNAGSTVYRLHAIVCHHGETIDAGHYTALVLRNGMWYHIDDAPPTATVINLPAELPAEGSLVHANPYIFFYVREGTGPYIVADDGTSEPAPAAPAPAAPAPAAPAPAAPAVEAVPAAPAAAVNGWSRVSPAGPAERDRQAAAARLVAAQARNPTVQVNKPLPQKTKKDRKDRKQGRKTRKRSKH
jgi:Ubiquitin carboxyl-terminal hydrolase